MKTSWLNGSKRILSALLIAAALMFGWTPLGEGKALAATDKGKQFAQAAMLFAKTGDTAFGKELYSGTNLFLSGGAWCVAFVAVVAKQCNIPESVIPNPNLKMTADLYAPATSSFHPVLPADKYVGSYAQYKSLYEANPNYTPQVGDIIVLNSYKDAAGKTYFSHWQHVGIVTAYNPTSKVVTFVSGNWGSVVTVSNYNTTKTTIEYWEDDETGCTVWSGILGYYHIDWSKVTSMREPNAVTGITLKDGNTELSDGALVALAPGDTRQITSTVSTKIPSTKAFYPDPDKGVYRQQGKMTLNTSYTGLYWKSSDPSIVKVDRNTGLLTAVKNGTATITVYAIADGKRTRATAVKTSFDVYVDSNLPVTREWYPYETQKNIELRTTPTYSSNNLDGTIIAGTELQIDLLHVTKAVVNSKTYWYAPVQLNDDEVVYCDISDQSVIRPMRAPSGNDWWKYKVVWKDGVNIRAFANSYPTTNIVTKIPTNDTVELDLNHTMREPKYGDTWAFARYKQSDGTYVYGWCIESDPEYTQRQERVEQFWYGYVPSQGCVVYVYQAQDIDSNIVAAYTADDYFQLEFNNTYRDNSGHFWAAAADNFGTEIGYVDLNDEYSSSGSITMYPSVTFISATEQHYAEVRSGSRIVAKVTPFDSAATVFTLTAGAKFWHGELFTYTDAEGQQWIPIYGQRYFDGGYECCGWIKAGEGYFDVRQEAAYVRSYSVNGKTYKLYDGPMSWSDALSMAVDMGESNDAVNQTLATIRSNADTEAVRVLLGSGNIDYAWLGACSSDGLNWTWFDGSEMKYTYWMPEHPYEWPDSALVAYVSGEWTLFADAPQMAVQGFITEQFTGIGLPQVKLPASTFYVDDEAFVGNSTIQAVVAPDGLQVIGTRAFADCANLKCITLPDSVSYIAEDAFENTPDVVIFASVGSYAWQWAEKQGIPHGTPYTE
mgnify:CR=1 FL=1